MSTYRGVNARLAKCLHSVLNVKALLGAFNQEKALVGAFSVIVQLHRLIHLRHYFQLSPLHSSIPVMAREPPASSLQSLVNLTL